METSWSLSKVWGLVPGEGERSYSWWVVRLSDLEVGVSCERDACLGAWDPREEESYCLQEERWVDLYRQADCSCSPVRIFL